MYCRQRTDERLRRGGEQKSVVVLAAQPHSSVLRPLSQHAGALYFNRGPAALVEVRRMRHTLRLSVWCYVL